VSPHPEHEMARRIARLREMCPAGVTVTSPLASESGKWEAAGKDWAISEESPVVFCDELEKRLWSLITAECDRLNELNRQRRFGAAAGEPGEDGGPIG